jgi:mediator of RNA polymerase II transcription subunit 23
VQVKQRCTVLEEQLVDLVVLAMQRSETGSDLDNEDGGTNQLLWQHLSSQVIFFVLFQFASFPHMVMALYDKVRADDRTQFEMPSLLEGLPSLIICVRGRT